MRVGRRRRRRGLAAEEHFVKVRVRVVVVLVHLVRVRVVLLVLLRVDRGVRRGGDEEEQRGHVNLALAASEQSDDTPVARRR